MSRCWIPAEMRSSLWSPAIRFTSLVPPPTGLSFAPNGSLETAAKRSNQKRDAEAMPIGRWRSRHLLSPESQNVACMPQQLQARLLGGVAGVIQRKPLLLFRRARLLHLPERRPTLSHTREQYGKLFM